MNEDKSPETGSLVLDLAMKMGMIKEKEGGGYKPGDDLDAMRAYVFGDVKVLDNLDKCTLDLITRGLSMDDNQETADLFVDIFNHIVPCMGDWHGGLSQLQSIYTVWYKSSLEPLKIALGWSRISQDVRGCYYQASRLAMLLYQMLCRMLSHTFVSEKYDDLLAQFKRTAKDLSDENLMCFMGTKFGEWIESLHDSDDDWLKCCSLYVSMVQDFLTFVESYRCGDSIGIEIGYAKFLPVWRALGQTRYQERVYRQWEQLFLKMPFRMLEELRRNRTSNPYHGSLGKHHLAMDEALELANRFFAQFPIVRSREAFAKQSNYIGLAKKCKRFILALVEMKSDPEQKVYKSAKTPKQKAECDYILAVLKKLKTSYYVKGRKFGKGHVPHATKSTKSSLADAKLQRQIQGTKTHNAYSILSSIEQILDSVELVARETAMEDCLAKDGPSKEKLSKKDQEQREREIREKVKEMMDDDGYRCTEGDAVDEPTVTAVADAVDPKKADSRSADKKKSEKLGYNRFMIESVWVVGRQRLLTDNVMESRTYGRKRTERTMKMNIAIRGAAAHAPSGANTFKKEVRGNATCWTKMMRSKYPDLYKH